MKHKQKRIFLALIPLLMLGACSAEITTEPSADTASSAGETNTISPLDKAAQGLSPFNQKFVNNMKNDTGFYQLEFDNSVSQLRKIGDIDVSDDEREWALFLNDQSKVFKSFNKDTGQQQVHNVLANKVWLEVANNRLVLLGSLSDGWLQDKKVLNDSTYQEWLGKNFNDAKQAGYKGTSNEWNSFVLAHTKSMTDTIKAQSQKDQIKSITALNVWNDAEARNLAIIELIHSYQAAQKDGYKGSIEDWFNKQANLLLTKPEEQKAKTDESESSNDAVAPTAATHTTSGSSGSGLLTGFLLGSLMSASNSNSYANSNYHAAGFAQNRNNKNDDNQGHSAGAGTTFGRSGRGSSNSSTGLSASTQAKFTNDSTTTAANRKPMTANTSTALRSIYSVSRGGFSSSHSSSVSRGG